jgi:hypothetical protein
MNTETTAEIGSVRRIFRIVNLLATRDLQGRKEGPFIMSDPSSSKPEPATERVRVVRNPRRGHYDVATIHAILDEGMIAHVGFPDGEGGVVVIPTAYARVGEEIVMHAAHRGRFASRVGQAPRISVAVTLLDGLVLARSAFHHSMNYRSVVVVGRAREVVDREEKRRFLDALVERLVPGRPPDVRGASEKELDLTSVLSLALREASAKIRTGDPVDAREDLHLPAWAGVLPLTLAPGTPLPARDLAPGIGVPEYVRAYSRPCRPLG